MGNPVTATTELQAVNTCLTNIGETPVQSLEDETVVDASMALEIVRAVTRELQSQSWHWNTDIQIKLTRNLSGRVVLAPNVLRVKPSGPDQHLPIVQRGTYLYNRLTHSYNFDHDITVDQTLGLPFDEIPETARRFISLRAARIFQERTISSESIAQSDRADEFTAYTALVNEETNVSGYNYLADNLTTQRIVNRAGLIR
jgi:hypothetical protein